MTEYTISPDRSTVTIDARSSLHPIHAENKGLTGLFVAQRADDGLDLSVAPSGRLEMDVSLLASGNPLYDREMQKRIDTRRYPTITGELKQIVVAPGKNQYMVVGTVTCRGVTQPATDTMTIEFIDDATVRLSGSHQFIVTDFGIVAPKILMLRVYPEVQVAVNIVAVAT